MWEILLSYWPWLLAGWLTGRLLAYNAPVDAIPGLPLLGNVLALGRHGVAFISRARRQFGDVFTINLGGKYMTWLHDPALIHAFFSAPDSQITFRPAVEQFTQRVYGLPSAEFFPKHANILKDFRHLLVPGELSAHAAHLAAKATSLMPDLFPKGEKVELFAASKALVFRSAVEILFGPQLVQCVPGGAQELERVFFEFDDAFELAASPLPHILLPGFTKSRAQLLHWLGLLHKSPGFATTTAGQLATRADLRDEIIPNMLLAVLWASQANTPSATFWSIAMLLLPENRTHADGVLAELRSELASGSGAGAVNPASDVHVNPASVTDEELVKAATKLAMDRKSTISKCVAEAVRLRSHSIDLRIAAEEVELTSSTGTKVRFPKGRLLAVCPWESHHDLALYPDAWRFNPDRAPLALGDGAALVTSVAGLAFGGGSYRCPGRFFAEMEVALLAQLVLWRLRLELVSQAQATDAPAQAATGDAAPARVTPHEPGLAAALVRTLGPLAVQLMGERAVWGLGLFEFAGQGLDSLLGGAAAITAALGGAAPGAPAAEGGAGVSLETWRTSGDEQGLLPRCNLHRLVGLKVPCEPCFVNVGPGPHSS